MAAAPSVMRLRQVALAARDLDAVTARLHEAFGLEVAYNDPGIIHYGLKNAVLPAGRSFIEVVQPVREGSSAGRFLDRRGGDAGYMLILQVADAKAEQARAEALGVRVVDVIDRADYACAHFHPGDFGGVLVSFDQQRTTTDPLEPYGDWWPAGKDWRGQRTDVVEDLDHVVIATPDPQALARRWTELLGRPASPDDPLTIPLDAGEIRFEKGDSPTSLAAIGLKLAEGAHAGGPAVDIAGVRFEVG